MTKDSFINKIDNVKKYIKNNRIADAIELLMKIASVEGQYKITDALSQLKQTYSYLIHYMLQGVEDNSREALYSSIKESLLSVADDLLIGELAVESADLYYSALRMNVLNNANLADLLEQTDRLVKRIENTVDDSEIKSLNSQLYSLYNRIFNILWTSRKNKKDNELIYNWISDNRENTGMVLYYMVPICLSLLQYYDSKKLALIINLYNAEISEEVSALALTSFILVSNIFIDRIRNDRELINLLSSWSDSDKIIEDTKIVLKHILHTFDTERAFTKMNNEVIPELMKMQPEFIKKFGNINPNNKFEELENNPDWEEMMDNSGLGDKLKELSDMQQEGADLMMISFSNLKQFHFFNSIDSWFIPFSANHPVFSTAPINEANISMLDSLGASLCDSDKYSLALALQKLPEQQSAGMLAQLRQQLDQAKEILGDVYHNKSTMGFEESTKSFIKVLHRFFKFFNKKNEFKNPFNVLLKFNLLPAIGERLLQDDISRITAEYYFKRNMYSYALYWFEHLEKQLDTESYYWEKVGYCYQSLNQYDKALVAYQKAELLKDPSPWLLRQLASMSAKTGNIQNAVAYYEKALAANPDNLSMIFNLGNLNLELGNIQQALKYFYHANYISPDDMKIWRAIGWSELLNKNFEKSDLYYGKILSLKNSDSEQKPSATDYMNAAHAKLLLGNLKESSDLYAIAASMDPINFEKDFNDDADTLKSLGVDSLTLNILFDKTRLSD